MFTQEGRLRVYLPSNYIYLTDSFYLDRNILRPDNHLKYDVIDIKFKGKMYSTTRQFWLHNGTFHKDNNYIFLQRIEFGINYAKAWEKYKALANILKYQIFDRELWTSGKLMSEWIAALEVEEKYLIIKKHKIHKYQTKENCDV